MLSIKDKVAKVDESIDCLEAKQEKSKVLFKGIQGKYVSKKRKQKESLQKSRTRKKRRLMMNLMRVYNICVQSSIDNENNRPQSLMYPPTILIPKQCINVEGIASLRVLDAECVAALLQSESPQFSNAAARRLLTNLKQKLQDQVLCLLFPESCKGKDDGDDNESNKDEDEDEDVDEDKECVDEDKDEDEDEDEDENEDEEEDEDEDEDEDENEEEDEDEDDDGD